MANRVFLDLNKLRRGSRTEAYDKLGHIIADPGVQIDIGKYTDSMGMAHACIGVSDPQLEGGVRRVYLISRSAAARLAEGLRKAASEVAL